MVLPRGFSEKRLGFSLRNCARDSYRIFSSNKHTKILICYPKGFYSSKTRKCNVGTKSIAKYTKKL